MLASLGLLMPNEWALLARGSTRVDPFMCPAGIKETPHLDISRIADERIEKEKVGQNCTQLSEHKHWTDLSCLAVWSMFSSVMEGG